MIASVIEWLRTVCAATQPADAPVEVGAEFEKRAPVVPSVQLQILKESFDFDGTITGREETDTIITLRRRLYGRSLPVRIIIYRHTIEDVDATLNAICRAGVDGLHDADGNHVRVTPVSAQWVRRTALAAQNESCILDVLIEGGVTTDRSAPRITGVIPEPDDQED